ncbi:MAG: hypothetical protein ACP5P1_15435 [Acidimicrobiales bacterium]
MSDDLSDSMGSLSAIAAEVFAAEVEMARRTENLSYMARVMAQVTLPHSCCRQNFRTSHKLNLPFPIETDNTTRVGSVWTYPCRPGRPPIVEELVTLIVAMASGNPTWGYQRIRGELLGLRRRVAASAIARVLKAHGMKPAPRRSSATWYQFLCQ